MPGLQRAPGDTDIRVSDKVRGNGYNVLERQFRDSTWTFDDATTKDVLQDFGSLKGWRNDHKARAVPTTSVDKSTDDDDDSASDVSVHQGFENRRRVPPTSKFRILEREGAGLPPTPPTMSNSDVTEIKRGSDSNTPLLFTDGLQNALQSRKSGSNTTPVNQLSPPTPDSSPPNTSEDSSRPAMQQKQKPHFLHPLAAVNLDESHSLRQYPSSRADSFKTAIENQAPSPSIKGSRSPVHLPKDDELPKNWLNSPRALDMAYGGLGDNMIVAETPKIDDLATIVRSRKKSRRQSKHESPPQTRDGLDELTELEKHISYVSGPDELDEYQAISEAVGPSQPAHGLGLLQAGMQADLERSVEDVNNQVYQHLQEENARRHGLLTSNSSAISAGIFVPLSSSTHRKLKRTVRCESLRDDASVGSDSKKGGLESVQKLMRKREVLPSSPKDPKPEVRQFSSPARLSGPITLDMAALTFASMQDSPTGKKAPGLPQRGEHKLRHVSHGDRLYNNPAVKRTSLEISPQLGTLDTSPPPLKSGPHLSNGGTIEKNMSVKRSQPPATAEALPKPGTHAPRTPPLRVRGVISSVTTDAEELSPDRRSLRRFSRDERLENNDHVRRTSLDRTSVGNSPQTSPAMPSPGLMAEAAQLPVARTHRRSSSVDKELVQRPVYGAHGRSTSAEKSAWPPSPRKSIDARHQHPTMTPLSTSGYSDRTDAVEVCEANGVRLYPHHNESLLVIQQSSQMVSDGHEGLAPASRGATGGGPGLGQPVFAAQVDPPTPRLRAMNNADIPDSPLTNPRLAPEPPVINFIPPTPNRELDSQPTDDDDRERPWTADANGQQRRLSLLQRARRYSDSLFARPGSLRKPRQEQQQEERPSYLSPMWRPQRFWDDDFSSDEDEDEDDFEPARKTLPRGGDTSDVDDDREQKKGLVSFPRQLSKRLPGFRGSGGFLVGNSLGIDRHGTNNRRHYVSTSSRKLSERQSRDFFDTVYAFAGPEGIKVPPSQEGERRRVAAAAAARRSSSLHAGRSPWYGIRRFRAKMSTARAERERKWREKKERRWETKSGRTVMPPS